MRYDCPVQATGRRAKVAIHIGGYRIEPGDFLTPVIGAANRDPMRFARPDELDITRADNRHLGFAHGRITAWGLHWRDLKVRSPLGPWSRRLRGSSPVDPRSAGRTSTSEGWSRSRPWSPRGKSARPASRRRQSLTRQVGSWSCSALPGPLRWRTGREACSSITGDGKWRAAERQSEGVVVPLEPVGQHNRR